MADPRRLLEDPAMSALGRELLASAADDAPPPDRRGTVARRLGIAALTLTGGSEVGSAIAAALWWKLGGVLALLGAIVGVAVIVRDPAPPVMPAAPTTAPVRTPISRAPMPVAPVAPAPTSVSVPLAPAAVSVTAPRPTAVKRAPVRARAALDGPPSAATSRLAPVRAAEPVAPSPTTPAPPAPPPQIDARRLAAEVAVLDRARAALRRGDTAAALTALEAHRRAFADGALVAEADAVRIEALVQAGQRAAAAEHARMFLARYPGSPLARRVRSLVERVQEAP